LSGWLGDVAERSNRAPADYWYGVVRPTKSHRMNKNEGYRFWLAKENTLGAEGKAKPHVHTPSTSVMVLMLGCRAYCSPLLHVKGRVQGKRR